MKVAVTRPRGKSAETLKLIKRKGGEGIIISSTEIVPTPISPRIHLEDFDWLVVTSAVGAELLHKHFGKKLKNIDIAVVGPKTKAAFTLKGIHPKVVAEEHVGEGLARDLKESARGQKVLVARAFAARKELVKILSKTSHVTEVPLYETRFPSDKSSMEEFKNLLLNGEVDAVVFTSSLAAKNLLSFLGSEVVKTLNKTLICAIGPITAATLEKQGVNVNCVPETYTIDAALDEVFKRV